MGPQRKFQTPSSVVSGASAANGLVPVSNGSGGYTWLPPDQTPGSYGAITNQSPGASYTPDASKRFQQITLTQNITINAATNVQAGSRFTLSFVQDATGGRTVTWDTSYGNSLPRVSPAPWAPTIVPFVNLGTAAAPVWENESGAGAGQLYTLGSAAGPALGSGWTQAGAGWVPATFYADANNKVHLSGGLTQTAVAAATAWTMPLGYYPKTGTIYIPCMRSGGTAGGYIGITNAGVVQFTPGNTATSWSLDGISFPAGV